ncbi:hypothetical protein NIES593_18850 [Hydrococcus rivularis NIES-593]|uniref:Uncharacterized protein n=1 Tax=Hydrococcus rivularis NIES-593 TaxID=1921803 RepID=A0A1U7HA14_9CYAN|nr:hypothetical protein [Hydrococcus rivularis]OKH20437.1 hypothetical protein NIES593_18850 [Hydrococcus rivularis NIES-593]
MIIFDLEYVESIPKNTNLRGGMIVANAAGMLFYTEALGGSILGTSGILYGASAIGSKAASATGTNNSYIVVSETGSASGSSSTSMSIAR